MIAWGVADSVVLRRFLGLELYDSTRDHTTISLRRGLINMETHRTVFDWVLKMSADEGLLNRRPVEFEPKVGRSRDRESCQQRKNRRNLSIHWPAQTQDYRLHCIHEQPIICGKIGSVHKNSQEDRCWTSTI